MIPPSDIYQDRNYAHFDGATSYATLASAITIDRTKNTVITIVYKRDDKSRNLESLVGASTTNGSRFILFTDNGYLFYETNVNDDRAECRLLNNDEYFHTLEITVNNSTVSVKQDKRISYMLDEAITEDLTFQNIGKNSTLRYFKGNIASIKIVEDDIVILDIDDLLTGVDSSINNNNASLNNITTSTYIIGEVISINPESMILRGKVYPNYSDDGSFIFDELISNLTIKNESKLSDIKAHPNIDRLDVMEDEDRGIEKPYIRIESGESHTFDTPISLISLASCTGEVVDITLSNIKSSNTSQSTRNKLNITCDTFMSKAILFKRGGKTLFRLAIDSVTDLRLSNDDIVTDERVITFEKEIEKAFITRVGTILLWSNGKVLRSTDDGALFTEVLSGVEAFYNENAVDEGITGSIAFAEYGADGVETKSVFFSNNDGQTWAEKLTVNHPGDIRHFHTCKFNGYDQSWYITSGDNDTQCRWYRSNDKYMDEVYEIELEDKQLWRTVAMFFTSDGYVVWSSDSIQKNVDTGVFKRKLSFRSYLSGDKYLYYFSTNTVIPLLLLKGTSYGCDYIDGNIVVSTYYSNVSTNGDGIPSIYVSQDMGRNWSKVAVWEFTEGLEFPSGGFRSTIKDYKNDVFYLPGANDLEGHGVFTGRPYSLKLKFH